MFDKPRYLIAVITCEKNKARADACRKTWVTLATQENLDVKFFLAKQDRSPLSDEVFLDCEDDYQHLKQKVQLMVRWAREKRYAKVFKQDDDSYTFPDRLLDAVPSGEYAGHVINDSTPERQRGFCSGFGYWLGKNAMRYVAKAVIYDDEQIISEDWWVGVVLASKGIQPVIIEGITPANCTPRKNCVNSKTICACEFDPKEMQQVHAGPNGWRERAAVLEEQRRLKMEKLRNKPRPMRGDGTPL